MSRTAADTDWLRRFGALTVEPDGEWPRDQILAARLLIVRLVCAARALSRAPESLSACPAAAASLVPALARADVPGICGEEAPPGPDLAASYLRALCDAAGAVYFCRRVEHASDRCWFSADGPSADICGRVLAEGHRCASSV